MMKKVILFLMLLVGVGAQAATNDGHVWLKLQSSNVRMDEAVNHFGEWINLPAESTFELLSDETDQIGMRHLRYRQYVAGVEVQASMLIVHGRDGLVTTANGVVMEQQEQPKTIRRAAATRGGYENCYLVKDDDGYHYARLDYDIFGNADIYVDIETGKVVKSLPRKHSTSMTMYGRSIYNGTLPLYESLQSDGSFLLVDNTRNIFTLNAMHVGNDNAVDYQYKDENGIMMYDREKYISERCSPFAVDANYWTTPQLVQVTLDKVTPQNDPYAEIYLVIKDSLEQIIASSNRVFVSSLPLSYDNNLTGGLSAYVNIGSYCIEICLYQYLGDDIVLDCINFESLSVGEHEWQTNVSSGHLTIAPVAHPAVDAHWGMQQTYDWYKNTFGRKSYDDKESPIYNILFAPSFNRFVALKGGNNNAFAQLSNDMNCPVMIYGMGDGVQFRPFVCLDQIAHEYTHLITYSTARLEYLNESGALNESFSDMMAACIKYAVKGSKANTWLYGSELTIEAPCMRDMSHNVVGTEGIKPIYYKGENWIYGNRDDGGVHTNSGVPNYWFYLVASSYGMEVASNIAYRTLTQYLTPTSNFYDARKATLQVADDIYGYDEEWDFGFEYKSVESAWNEVGVFDKTDPTGIIAVTRMVNNNETDNWYNLQGQRIDKPSQPGVYIHNGKKVFIK